MQRYFYLIVFVLFSVSSVFSVVAGNAISRSDSIKVALDYQRINYPSSHYRDVYKNFMQDYFGPGHILNDTVAAGNYLRYELENAEYFDGPDYEPTGFEGNFYRVNLRLIKEGVVAYDTFFDAFVESVQVITPPESEMWLGIWRDIDNEITRMGWHFQDEEQDRTEMAEQFERGDFVVHHSEAFNQANNFHYRIISKTNFNKTILPLLMRK